MRPDSLKQPDLHPDGRSVRLSTGLIRARFRSLDDPVYKIDGSNFETEELLSGDPADVVRYEFSIPSVANTFKAGHRIRIAVMNALDDYSFPNSNTGERVDRDLVVVVQEDQVPEAEVTRERGVEVVELFS